MYIMEYDPDILGISIMYSSDIHSLHKIARLIKDINPNIIVVAGGIHPSIYPREVLLESCEESGPAIDYVIRGEGEIRFADFITNSFCNPIGSEMYTTSTFLSFNTSS